jgi:SAM-dependent methyltransferase
VPERADEHPESDTALRENYATNANLEARRGLLDYAVAPPTPQPNVIDVLEWSDDACVLDVGCGDGVWAVVATQRTQGGSVVGLDFSLGMLHALPERSRDVLRVQGDANVLPIRTGSVDVVLAMWMLYHVDRDRAIAECRRVLRPHGKLIAATNESSFLPGLDDFLNQAASEVAGRQLDEWLGTLAFNLETGAHWLTPHFANVERVVNETPFEVPDAAPLLAYIDSVRGPAIARQGDAFDYDAFRSLVEAELERRLESGPIRFDRRIAFFVASN